MTKQNPLTVLEFTPSLVRLLQENPNRLLKVAESHKRWLLAAFHPDRDSGGLEKSQQISEAFITLQDSHALRAAADEFLRQKSDVRAPLINELRIVREDLSKERSNRLRESQEASERQKHLEERATSALINLEEWIMADLFPRDKMMLRENDNFKIVSLVGTMLVTGSPGAKYVLGFMVGEGRRIHQYVEWPRATAEKISKSPPIQREAHKKPRPESVVFGSFAGEHSSMASVYVEMTPAKVRAMAPNFRPYLEVGKPIIVLERREKGNWFAICDRLLEIKRGALTKVELLQWLPEGSVPSPGALLRLKTAKETP